MRKHDIQAVVSLKTEPAEASAFLLVRYAEGRCGNAREESADMAMRENGYLRLLFPVAFPRSVFFGP